VVCAKPQHLSPNYPRHASATPQITDRINGTPDWLHKSHASANEEISLLDSLRLTCGYTSNGCEYVCLDDNDVGEPAWLRMKNIPENLKHFRELGDGELSAQLQLRCLIAAMRTDEEHSEIRRQRWHTERRRAELTLAILSSQKEHIRPV
jgi:hypothetical protein